MDLQRSAAQARAPRASEGGFTLIELLVVIVILGILTAVTVFSVGNLGDKGQASACKVDTRTLDAAEAAYFADQREKTGQGKYADEQTLWQEGYLKDLSPLHNVHLDPVTGEPIITLAQDGLPECFPSGKTASDCAPIPTTTSSTTTSTTSSTTTTTLPTTTTTLHVGSPIKICLDEGRTSDPAIDDDDVIWPF